MLVTAKVLSNSKIFLQIRLISGGLFLKASASCALFSENGNSAEINKGVGIVSHCHLTFPTSLLIKTRCIQQHTDITAVLSPKSGFTA